MHRKRLLALFLVLTLLFTCVSALAAPTPEQTFLEALAKTQAVEDMTPAYLSKTLQSLLDTAKTWDIDVSAANRALLNKIIKALEEGGAPFADLDEETRAAFLTMVDDLRDEVLRRTMEADLFAGAGPRTSTGGSARPLDLPPDSPQ